MGEVLKLVIDHVGDGTHIEADQILEAAKGDLTSIVLVGVDKEGDIRVAGTDSAGESVLLLEWAKLFLVQNLTSRS